MSQTAGRFVRVAEKDRAPVRFVLDGVPVEGRAGDSVLVAILANAAALRQSEFGGGARAGFCLMAACQDCWVWTEDGRRLRACDTPLREGMRISTRQDGRWAVRA
ncbi:MAG: (2Fe-2S)-binding protein [Hyphomicrobiaceae bacterium]|nr:MAG: (2Fe-2S)-binding protein [Hyphomicrobiaceae bacterium]